MQIVNEAYPMLELSEVAGENSPSSAEVVVVYAGGDAPQTALLDNILKAVGRDGDRTVRWVMPPGGYAPLMQWADGLGVDYVIVFGLALKRLCININVDSYQLVELGGKHLLLSDSLSHISEHPKSKRALWEALKKMFGV